MVLAAAVLGLATGARAQTAWDGVFSGTATLTYQAINDVFTPFDPFSAAFVATAFGSADDIGNFPVAVSVDVTGGDSLTFTGPGNIFGPEFPGANFSEYDYGFGASRDYYTGISLDLKTNDVAAQSSGTFFLEFQAADGSDVLRSYDLTNVSYSGDDKPPYKALPAPPAPEPATWLLMMAGVGVVGWGLRRQPAAQAAMSVATSRA